MRHCKTLTLLVLGWLVTAAAGACAPGALTNNTPGTLAVGPAQFPNADIGVPYAYTVGAAGGAGGYQWTILLGVLPDGLVMSVGGDQALFSGVASPAATNSQFIVQVSDALGAIATRACEIGVNGATATAFQIVEKTLLDGYSGQPYGEILTTAGGSGASASWTITGGVLPAGLSLDAATGTFSGTVTATDGSYGFTVQAVESSGAMDSFDANIAILPAPASGTAITVCDPATMEEVGSLTFDGSGNLYIAQTKSNSRVHKLNIQTRQLSLVMGNSSGVWGQAGTPAANSKCDLPAGLCLDAAGNIYMQQALSSYFCKIDTNGLLAFYSMPVGFAGYFSIAITPAGDYVYTANFLDECIYGYDMASGSVDVITGSTMQRGYAGDGGPAWGGLLGWPVGLGMDGQGNLYVADSWMSLFGGANDSIRKLETDPLLGRVSPSSIISTVPNTLACGVVSDVAVDALGSIYYCTANAVVSQDLATGTLTTMASMPSAIGNSGILAGKRGLARDPLSGDIYFSAPSGVFKVIP